MIIVMPNTRRRKLSLEVNRDCRLKLVCFYFTPVHLLYVGSNIISSLGSLKDFSGQACDRALRMMIALSTKSSSRVLRQHL
ncbi:hypothetical protein BDW42DRAFT_157808 [Aspergillus taichungensis]|uniref:Uncharacterized protein n=1 Tax=Aspergillus taichungensis TaxID=482145 RepID=A0A2J5IA74_9EURO|nr:hypothetical protein BDW42DRAFT_157808 [Aspergillus taichungensis]